MKSFLKASFFILLGALQFAPTSLYAQRVANARGLGLVGCGEFLEDRKSNAYQQSYAQWVTGFLSGYNLYSVQPKLTRLPDEATIGAYLEKHCRDNPLDTLMPAAMGLIKELGGFNPTTSIK